MSLEESRTHWRSSYVRVAEWYGAGLFIVYIVLLFAHKVMPSLADFSDWTYEGVLLRNHLLGVHDSAHVLKHYPVPNSAVTVGIALLALLLPWQIAAKVWLTVTFAISFFVTKHMMQTCRGNPALWFIIPSAIFLNVNLWYGFVNFQLGLCWVILMASLLLRNVSRPWLIGLLLIVAFFTHMIPFAFAALLLILYAVQTRRFSLLWQLVPGMALTAWYVIARFVFEHNADGNSGMVNPVRTFSGAFWAYKVNTWLKSFGFVNPGTVDGSVSLKLLGPTLFVILFFVNVVLCAAIGWCLFKTLRLVYREERKERFIWTAALIVIFVYLLMPGIALGISDPGSRLLQTALATIIFLCTTAETSDRNRLRVAAGCSVLLTVTALFLFEGVVFSPQKENATSRRLSHRVVVFAHVSDHDRDYLYRALEDRDMDYTVWPTGMFLNTPAAKVPLN